MSTSPRSRIPWPPLLYAAAIAAALWLGIAFPLPWLGEPLAGMLFVVGLLLAAAVIAIDLAALRTLSRSGTTVVPGREATRLVTGGPYAVSRNPIYLAHTMVTIGIGLMTGNAWFLPLALAAAFATTKLAVEPEERQLEAQFGRKYRDYKAKVRRWI